MFHCQNCRANDWVSLLGGGCGGNGQIKGCKNCKSVFLQTTGGFIGTPGGEAWQRLPYTLDEYQKLHGDKKQ